ncbi:tRNA (guanine-N(7)-)-methyltransferase [Clostridia bacterium]|nr:tRNA (guanine-N(7)-)-methyltransferase [Clostridia bacterium]
MRMRKKKHAQERIDACADLLLSGEPSESPLYLEIGCGKGDFIIAKASESPDANFIAVEVVPDVIVTALEKAKAAEPPLRNLKFLLADALDLPKYIASESVSGIYLNFSDPWHKHKKFGNRLTSAKFTEIYSSLLKPGGFIAQKTDNAPLFDFSLRRYGEAGFKTERLTRDLYNSEWLAGNIATEYERGFVDKGLPIHYALVRKT